LAVSPRERNQKSLRTKIQKPGTEAGCGGRRRDTAREGEEMGGRTRHGNKRLTGARRKQEKILKGEYVREQADLGERKKKRREVRPRFETVLRRERLGREKMQEGGGSEEAGEVLKRKRGKSEDGKGYG